MNERLLKLRDELAKNHSDDSSYNSELSFCKGFDAATKELEPLIDDLTHQLDKSRLDHVTQYRELMRVIEIQRSDLYEAQKTICSELCAPIAHNPTCVRIDFNRAKADAILGEKK